MDAYLWFSTFPLLSVSFQILKACFREKETAKSPGLGQFSVAACGTALKSFKLKIGANKYSYFRQKTVLILICKELPVVSFTVLQFCLVQAR